MPSYRCLKQEKKPEALAGGLLFIVDDKGQGWVCREEESPEVLNERLGASEYAWGYYVMGIAAEFAGIMGMKCGDWNDISPVLDRTSVVSAPEATALARVLSGHPA